MSSTDHRPVRHRPVRHRSELQFTTNREVRLAYQDWGGRGGDPLLMATGLGGDHGTYPPGFISELLAAGFHVATYDYRDTGESTRVADTATVHPLGALLGRPEAYTAEDMADDAVAIIDALGWDSAHLFGFSMGGLVAQRVALRHPDHVRALAVMSTLPSDAGRLRALSYLGLSFIRQTIALQFPAREGDTDTAPAAGAYEREAQSRQLAARWSGSRLSQLRAPTVVLVGADDPIVRPAAGRALARAVPDARLIVFPGVGHDLPQPLWGRIVAAVRDNGHRYAPTQHAQHSQEGEPS